jgi:acylphosphatase
MRIHSLLHRTTIGVATLTSCVLVATAPAQAKSKLNGANLTAISGIVSGKVQQVGFRAMIQKQAIENNLAGSAENNDDDKTVRFNLQGDKNRVNQAVAAIKDGTKKSSDVKVSLSPATFDPNLKTFTVMGWNSVSRKITNRYNLAFALREDNTTIKKKAAKQVWLGICTKAVAKTEDAGKCDKDDD